MSCDVIKFVISKGADNTFVFTIKQDNSTLPMLIDVSDTFFADLIALSDDSIYPQVADKVLTTVGDLANGQISLAISETDTANLVVYKGSEVDRYYLRPTYKLVLKCTTVANGDFIAKVPEVYVD